MFFQNTSFKILLIGFLFFSMNLDSISYNWEKLSGTNNYVNFLRFSKYSKNTLYVGSDVQATDFSTNNISFLFFGDGFQVSKDLGNTFSEPYLLDYSVFDVAEGFSDNKLVLMASVRKQDFGRIVITNDGGETWDLETNRCESSAQLTRIFSISEENKYKLYASAINSNSGFRFSDDFFVNCNISSDVKINARDISVSQIEPSTIYLVADNVSKQKVLVSKDKGQTWLDASLGLENYRILSVQASPQDRGTVFIGVDSITSTGKIIGMGIFMSIDYGASWVNVGALGASVYDIQFHPSNPKFWAAAGGDKGVFVSGKSGTYWENKNEGLPENFFARKVAIPDIEPTNDGIIVYASIYGNGIYKSSAITTSVEDEYTSQNDMDFNIFPNPASDFINIKSKNNSNLKYEIVGILSNIIKDGEINNNSNIDIQNLSAGTYFLRIFDGKDFKIFKFAKI